VRKLKKKITCFLVIQINYFFLFLFLNYEFGKEGKVEKSKGKAKTPRSQKKIATIKKSRY